MSLFEISDIAHFSIAGFTLNVEERASLKASLLVKQQEEKLDSINLWGKVLGIQRDYYLAQSSGADLLAEKKFYYRFVFAEVVLIQLIGFSFQSRRPKK